MNMKNYENENYENEKKKSVPNKKLNSPLPRRKKCGIVEFKWIKLLNPIKEAKFNMEYKTEAISADDYCSVSVDGDYFVQFCDPPLPSFVADNHTLSTFLTRKYYNA